MIVEAINLGQRLYMDADGDTYPIVVMYDDEGNDCEAPDAVSAVAGTEGRWYVIDVRDFIPEQVQ